MGCAACAERDPELQLESSGGTDRDATRLWAVRSGVPGAASGVASAMLCGFAEQSCGVPLSAVLGWHRPTSRRWV